MSAARTLYRKVWDSHVVRENDDGSCLLYVDCHLLNEATSPQAFAALRDAGRRPRRPEHAVAVADRAVPTDPGRAGRLIADENARLQVATLEANCREHGIPFLGMAHAQQGIVHVTGPELGLAQPGTVLVCGDSHTTTHGAFAALAYGIGTTEIEHVLATQTLRMRPSPTIRVILGGNVPVGVSAKDIILALIGRIGTSGAAGHVVEFDGPVVTALTMEGRMTICNMSIEAGARAALMPPDARTHRFLQGLPGSPPAAEWGAAIAAWAALRSDDDAAYDGEIAFDVTDLAPQVSWGTSPADVAPIDGVVPDPSSQPDPAKRAGMQAALDYMGLAPLTPMRDIAVDHVFIGSCTNGRIEDLAEAARVVGRHRVAPGVRALVVPGSAAVKRAAEARGIAQTFVDAGFEWREPGCSACVALNGDRVPPGGRCASTSNRNFRGRQGPGARTHLMSPAMAAAAAITGRFTDVRELG